MLFTAYWMFTETDPIVSHETNLHTFEKDSSHQGAFLAVQELRLRLPLRETQVPSLVQENPTESIAGWGTNILHATWQGQKKQNLEKKKYIDSSIVFPDDITLIMFKNRNDLIYTISLRVVGISGSTLQVENGV